MNNADDNSFVFGNYFKGHYCIRRTMQATNPGEVIFESSCREEVAQMLRTHFRHINRYYYEAKKESPFYTETKIKKER